MHKGLGDSIRYIYDNLTTVYTRLMVAVRKAEREVSDLKGAKPLTAKAVVSSEVGEESTECQTSSGAVEELHKQFANLKLLVIHNKKNGNGSNTTQKKKYSTEAIAMDPQLIVKKPVATVHGPFKENQLPVQCHCFHGWCQYPTKLRFKWEGEGENSSLQQATPNQGNITLQGSVTAGLPITNTELLSQEAVAKGMGMSGRGNVGRAVIYP